MFDVAIIGAGPAGAMLARLMGERYRVLLLDRRNLDALPVTGRPGKCCGGLLSANAQQTLAEQGLTVPSSIITANQPETVQVIDADNRLVRDCARPYINCHRELLDRWLLSLAPAQTDIRCGCQVNDVSVDESGVTVQYTAEGRRHTERARLLVGADGAHSVVRRQLFPQVASPRCYLAVQGWFEMATPLPHHVAIFDRAVTDYYGWAVPKDGLLAIGAALAPHADPLGHFDRLVQHLAAYGVSPGRLLWREGALIRSPMRSRELCTGNDRVVLLGEAAGWISPSSAEGFSYAYRSAFALAEAVADGLDGAAARYTTLTHPLRRALAHEARKCAGMYTPWLRALALRTQRPPQQPAIPPLTPADAFGRG